ncbi:hypothetical protein [Brunnivagina elsteri]|uniref:Transmembrane protein n=1 Tax=Brunnivagina elsteri CCALA 953 TaxID=987040 RepID=A0A2A2TFN5_9CYAN|nr:hypothetical protein [Calothrix elsteri]PAX52486.1 hypothetical protein CK510_18990 [Calothrix elsteri CCALA 953]
MKTKLIQLLTVSLVTLVILSPEILVFGLIWQNHLELEKTNFSIQSDNSGQTSNLQNNYVNNNDLNQQHVENLPILNSEKQESLDLLDTFKIILLIELLLFSLPVGLGLIFFLYDKYLMHRYTNYQKQIELLEEIWQYSIEEKRK